MVGNPANIHVLSGSLGFQVLVNPIVFVGSLYGMGINSSTVLCPISNFEGPNATPMPPKIPKKLLAILKGLYSPPACPLGRLSWTNIEMDIPRVAKKEIQPQTGGFSWWRFVQWPNSGRLKSNLSKSTVSTRNSRKTSVFPEVFLQILATKPPVGHPKWWWK